MKRTCLLKALRVTDYFKPERYTEVVRLVNAAVEITGGKKSFTCTFAYCVDRNAYLYIVRTQKISVFVLAKLPEHWNPTIEERQIIKAGFIERPKAAA